MRALTLIALATLSLAACRNNGQTDNTANIDDNLAAENIVSNDVTAIDAVTGDAANMAADVNYTAEANLAGESASTSPAPRPATEKKANQSPPATAPTTAPASNSTATATTTNAT